MTIRIWNLPKSEHLKIRMAFDTGNILWLLSIWDAHNVTDKPLCPSCPDTMERVEKEMQKWFDVIEKELDNDTHDSEA
jgi:hypothetical protein